VIGISYRYLLQACDIIIVFRKSNIFYRIAHTLLGNTLCKYTTSSIFLFLFDDLCADTTSSGIRNRQLFSYDRDKTTIIAARYLDVLPHQRNSIIEAALLNATYNHSFMSARIKKTSYSCTKFITQCFLDAGILLFPGKDPEDITINDFMECSLLEKIIIHECK